MPASAATTTIASTTRTIHRLIPPPLAPRRARRCDVLSVDARRRDDRGGIDAEQAPHVRPELVLGHREDRLVRERRDHPRAGRELGFELAGAPAGVAEEQAELRGRLA